MVKAPRSGGTEKLSHVFRLRKENGNGEEILLSLQNVRPGNGFKPDFTIMEKVEVNGENAHAVFQFLKSQLPYPSDDSTSFMKSPSSINWAPVKRNDISWNFEKFLVAPDGKPFLRYSKSFQTIEIQKDIKSLIEKFS
ncbi:glutathione peroxidase [Octopus vulgaris]|uniref:Glutathione peroxidase n=1 Tax=Octopus vulgaris TaxID=6645 RepID=A0AA36BAP3_OCTVU|nr:glutathione peroxidase [Octopus vulgaris]